MADALPYAAVATLVIGAWASGVFLLDLFAPADARAWQRMTHLRGFETRGSVLQRLARKAPPLTRLQRELDLERLLAQAHRAETPAGFVARTGAIALMTFALLLAASAAGRAVEGQWPVAPWIPLAVGLLIVPLAVLDLRRKARNVRARTARILGDTLMAVAVMTDTRGLQLDDAVRIMSRCAWDGALQELLDHGGFKRLVRGPYRSTTEKYRLIGDAYRIREFTNVADSAASANVGVTEREAYTRLALSVYQERLADARVHAARARILITIPIAGMLIPLLMLIGAPTFHAISSGLGG
ncbi:MAG TPA: hypothetical protein VMU65_15015 [Candidatus Saccharimonadales bacterium]|nr:hypothetical protein [Candidatus Saccharimonadales bacterium]